MENNCKNALLINDLYQDDRKTGLNHKSV